MIFECTTVPTPELGTDLVLLLVCSYSYSNLLEVLMFKVCNSHPFHLQAARRLVVRAPFGDAAGGLHTIELCSDRRRQSPIAGVRYDYVL